MRRLKLLFLGILSVCATMACADSDRLIQVKELPAITQQFLKRHFSGVKVSVVKQDKDVFDKDYTVLLANGCSMKFDRKGYWEEIECRKSAVPSSIVPAAIMRYVKANYPGEKVRKIEKDKKGYEVKLSNGVELKFDAKLQLVDVDVD